MSGFAEMRVLTQIMPEKIFLDEAIDALLEYRNYLNSPEAKEEDKPKEEEEDTTFSSIKKFLSGSKKEEEKKETPSKKKLKIKELQLEAKVGALLMKWRDEGKDPSEIIMESSLIEKSVKNSGLSKDDEK